MLNNNIADTENPYSATIAGAAISNLLTHSGNEYEKHLDGLDDETRKTVRKHMDEFHTVEEMEMFIKQKTNGGNGIL